VQEMLYQLGNAFRPAVLCLRLFTPRRLVLALVLMPALVPTTEQFPTRAVRHPIQYGRHCLATKSSAGGLKARATRVIALLGIRRCSNILVTNGLLSGRTCGIGVWLLQPRQQHRQVYQQQHLHLRPQQDQQ
jgi:hypothetical protein